MTQCSAPWLTGGGKVGARIRSFDWTRTSLGPMDAWPVCLRTAVSIAVNSPSPTVLWWGADFVEIHNDAWVSLLGAAQAERSFGRPIRGDGNSSWPVLGEQLVATFQSGVPGQATAQPIPRAAHQPPLAGSASLSPVLDEHGDSAGIFCTVSVDRPAANEAPSTAFGSHQEQLRQVIDAVPALLSYVNRDLRYEMCNRAYTDWFGLNSEEIVGWRVQDVLGAEAWQQVRPHLEAALQGEPREFEMEAPFGRGDVRCIHAVYTPHRSEDGSVVGVVAHISDISARKHAERELRESQALVRDVINGAPIILWVTDTDGRCVHINQQWFEFTGETVESGAGFGWLEAVHPDDRTAAEEKFLAANAAQQPFRLEYRLRRHDGVYRWVIDTATPRWSPDGTFLGFIGSVLDIQEHRESEDALRTSRERFDLVKDGAQVGFWFCDLPFDELIWDSRVKEHFWLPPDAPVPVSTFYERLHPDDLERTRAAIHRSIDEKTRYDIEYRTVDPGTSRFRWIRAIGRTFYNDAGKPIRFDGVTLDITERKQVEDELREAKEATERASRAKDEFLAQLSHELRTPLTPVLMSAAALREDASLPPALRKQLDMIERNVALEARLIDDLLDLTRITRGKLALRGEICDVHALLHLVVEIIEDETREKGIHLSLDLTAQRHHLHGDNARLQQVFWNLLRNAAKFTPENGHIHLRTRDVTRRSGDTETAHLMIAVEDDGIGFNPDAAERLFQPFEQDVLPHDPRFPGLGLGLAIARAIVDLHGGYICAHSGGRNQGAVFTVELPGARRTSRRRAASPEPAATRPPRLPALRLLLVEDHKSTLKVLSHLLRRDGHDVTATSTVATALEAAASGRFDLVMSDLGLPDGTGLGLMKQLRRQHGLRGIALSGYGMDEDLRRSRDAGFVAHLIKPVDLKELRRVLQQLAPRPS